MGRININDLDRYEENHRPFKKTRRSKKKKRTNENNLENQVKRK